MVLYLIDEAIPYLNWEKDLLLLSKPPYPCL